MQCSAADTESKRRTEEQRRVTQLSVVAVQQEDAASKHAREEITRMWNEIVQIAVPEELQHALEEQQERCDAVFTSKDAIIRDHKEILKARSEEFQKSLTRFTKEIGLLF